MLISSIFSLLFTPLFPFIQTVVYAVVVFIKVVGNTVAVAVLAAVSFIAIGDTVIIPVAKFVIKPVGDTVAVFVVDFIGKLG